MALVAARRTAASSGRGSPFHSLGVVNTFVCESEPWSHFVAIDFVTQQMRTCANLKPRSQAGMAAVLRGALQKYKASARAEARARTNVSQSVGPQPYRVGAAVAFREASVAFPPGLRLKLGMQLFCPSNPTPNPSIERTRSGSAGLAFISFWAKPAPPPRAAHVKR